MLTDVKALNAQKTLLGFNGQRCIVRQEYQEFVVDGDTNSSETVLGYSARRGGINITPRRQNVMVYVQGCLISP